MRLFSKPRALLFSFLLAGPFVMFVIGQARPPFELIGQSNELGLLQRIGASAAYAAQFLAAGPPGAQTKDLRVAAYCRLGRIGTLDSLDSMGRIEDGIMKIYRDRGTFWPNLHTLPQWHTQDSPLAPLVTLEIKEGIVGIFADTALGRHDFYISLTRAPLRANAPWTRPLLLPFPGEESIREPELQLKENRLLFSYSGLSGSGEPARVEHSFILGEIERDADRDGWTDIEELRLGLNPRKKDTDGDGIPDGIDPAPNYRSLPLEYKQPEVNLLQRAILATFGLSGSRHLLVVGPGSQRVQVAGYAGPVLYGITEEQWRQTYPESPWVEWRLADATPTSATVVIEDHSPDRRTGLQSVLFKRINNEWIVVERKLSWAN